MAQCTEGAASQSLLAASDFTEKAPDLLPGLNFQKIVSPLVSKAVPVKTDLSGTPTIPKKSASANVITAELAHYITVPSAKQLASLVQNLRAAGKEIGIAPDTYPSRSFLLLVAFCKGVSREADKPTLTERYNFAKPLLQKMEVDEVRYSIDACPFLQIALSSLVMGAMQ